jgi:hypothetical protein
MISVSGIQISQTSSHVNIVQTFLWQNCEKRELLSWPKIVHSENDVGSKDDRGALLDFVILSLSILIWWLHIFSDIVTRQNIYYYIQCFIKYLYFWHI